jgi:hypothetical protein
VTYTPSAADTGSRTITAGYSGGPSHAASTGNETLTVQLRSTSTSVNCSPGMVPLATLSTCTATVTDTAAGTASTPSGTVGFASDGSGTFNPDTSRCTFTQTSPGVASCPVTYSPQTSNTPSPTRTDTITATYGGDSTHPDSSGTAAVAVRPTSRADCQQGGWQNYGFSSQRRCLQSLSGGLGEPPETKADCQHGGWRTLGFRNQGQCIQSLGHGLRARGKPSRGGGR